MRDPVYAKAYRDTDALIAKADADIAHAQSDLMDNANRLPDGCAFNA